MDYQQIDLKYYLDSVNIESDDFHYISISRSHHGLQINENLKDIEDDILCKCDEISKLTYQLKDLIDTKSNNTPKNTAKTSK